jgi:large subunit ribosomal protein L5
MRDIYLDKVVVNIGIGPTEDKLENAKTLLKKLTGHEAGFAKAKKRFPEFGIRQGQIIGTMVTLRGIEALNFFKSALDANGNVLFTNSIANNSVNFGIKEYIYFSGVKYDPKIGMLGLNVNASFSRKGARVGLRKRRRSIVSKEHKMIKADELKSYVESKFGIKVTEKEG